MPTYKALDNSLHSIETEFAYMLPAGCIQIAEEEAEVIRAAYIPEIPEQLNIKQSLQPASLEIVTQLYGTLLRKGVIAAEDVPVNLVVE